MFRKLAVFVALAAAATEPAAAFMGASPLGAFRPQLRAASTRVASSVGPNMELTIVTGARYPPSTLEPNLRTSFKSSAHSSKRTADQGSALISSLLTRDPIFFSRGIGKAIALELGKR